jgi:AcrR family transcriptional regulator
MARLDISQIVGAAWKVVDRGGAEAFRIRTVAEELGISPMAIYHHAPNKAALAAAMVEAAYYEQPLAAPTGDWKEDLWLQARWLRETRLAHPAISAIHREYRTWTPALLRTTERWVNLWQQSGLPLDRALIAARASSQAIVGLVDEEAGYEAEEPPNATLLAALPSVRTMFEKDHCRASLFELCARSVIDGLYARLSAKKADLGRLLEGQQPA